MRRDDLTACLLTAVLLSMLMLSACATLNQAECQQANWHAIGFEDGTKGKLLSHIGRHRKACAKHGISPDLTAYQTGHRDGLGQFCTEPSGFSHGKAGKSYNGVCPAALDAQFRVGYRKGKELYTAKQAYTQAKSDLARHERDLERISKQIAENEHELINASTSESRRRELLSKLKTLQSRQTNLEVERRFLLQTIDEKEAYYHELRQRYAY